MEIRAGGRKWLVEPHEIEEGGAAVHGFYEVSFRRPEAEQDRVEMRWVPRSERLTETVAQRLFELAGERLWRDSRSGAIYRIHLVDEGRPGDDADPAEGRMLVHFRTAGGSATVPYDLDHPLGLATDPELEELADRVQERVRGVSA